MAPSIKETGAVTPRASKTAITKGVKKQLQFLNQNLAPVFSL